MRIVELLLVKIAALHPDYPLKSFIQAYQVLIAVHALLGEAAATVFFASGPEVAASTRIVHACVALSISLISHGRRHINNATRA